jgi:hypothetical protein
MFCQKGPIAKQLLQNGRPVMKRNRKMENYYSDRELPDLHVTAGTKTETTSTSDIISAQFTKVLDSLPFYAIRNWWSGLLTWLDGGTFLGISGEDMEATG